MKRLMKRWLAMVLAVLMVMGTLPMTAWAARIEDDAVPATPVVDGKDGVVDTLAKSGKDDDVIPIDPVDPDPGPADPLYLWDIYVEYINNGTYTLTIEDAEGGTTAADAASTLWSFAILPRIKEKGQTTKFPEEIVQISGDTTGSTAILDALTDYSDVPAGAIHVKGQDTDGQLAKNVGIVNAQGRSIDEIRAALKATGKEYVDYSGADVDLNDTIPMVAILCTQESPKNKTYFTFTAGGGIGDSIWYVNIYEDEDTGGRDAFIQKAVGGKLTDDDNASVTYSATPRVSIPLYNTAITAYRIPFDDTTNIPSATEYVTATQGDFTMVSKTETTASSEDPGYMLFDLANEDEQTIIFKVPYYTAEGVQSGVATVTVIVKNDAVAATGKPIEFFVKEGVPSTHEAMVDLTWIRSGGPIEDDDGNFYDDYATALWILADMIDDNGNRGSGQYSVFDEDAYSGLSLEGTEGYYEEEGLDFYYKVAVAEDDSKPTKVKLVYTGDLTYSDPGPDYETTMTIELMETGGWWKGGMIDIPVIIHVEPGDVVQKYYMDWVNPATGAPPKASLSPGLPTDSTEYTAGQPTKDWTNPAADGWTFKGWTTKSGTTLGATATTYIVNAADADENYIITLTAVWERISYTLTFDSNGGMPTTAQTKTVDHGNTGPLLTDLTAPDRTDYTFANRWNTAKDGTGTDYVPTATVTGPQTYYAVWTRNTSTVEFDVNGGTLPASSGDYTQTGPTGTAASKPGTDPTRANAKFDGWSASNGGAATTTFTFPDVANETKTYYARWLTTLTYDVNLPSGVTGITAPGASTGLLGRSITAATLAGNTPSGTCSTHTFMGWAASTDDAAAGTLITSDITMNQHTTVYGVWEEKQGSAKITLNLDTSGKYTGQTVSLQGVTTTWAESSGVYTSAENVAAGTYSILVNGADTGITVTVPMGGQGAQSIQYYTVSVSVSPANSGSATMTVEGVATPFSSSGTKQSTVVQSGKEVAWAFGTPALHYHEVQWDSSGSFAAIPAAAVTTGPVDHVAYFALDTHTVIYDKNCTDGTVAFDKTSDTVTYNTSVSSLASVTTARPGYTLGGWYQTKAADGTLSDQFTTSINVTENMTVYAKWNYTVSYDLNSTKITVGTYTPTTIASQIGTEKTAEPAAAAAPTADYFNFTGWNTKADGTGTSYAAGDPVPGGNTTLYAQWEPKKATITVKFRLNGDEKYPGANHSVTVGSETQTLTSGSELTFNRDQTSTPYNVTLDTNVATKIATLTSDDGDTVYFDYYTLTVAPQTTGTNGVATAKVAAGTTAPTSATDSSVGPTTYYDGTKVYIKSDPHDPNYIPLSWASTKDGTNAGGSPAVKDATNGDYVLVEAQTYLTATFQKVAYSATIKVFLNDVQQMDSDLGSGKPIGVPTIAKTLGSTTETPVMTYSSGVWTASNLRGSNTYTVTVVGANGTYTDTITAEGKNVEANFYGVTVVDGDYGNTTTATKPYLNATGTQRAVMPVGTAVAIKANPDNGYQFDHWLEGDTATPTAVLVPATKKVTAPGDGNFSFNTGYKAATAGKDLYLKPVYTFTATVNTKEGSTNKTPGGTVKLTYTEAGTDGSKTLTESGTQKGQYVVSGLTPNVEYTVWVNGFKTATKFNAPTKADVALVTLTGAGYNDSAAAAGGGTVKLTVGGTEGPGENTSIYVPSGATTGADSGPSITAKATTSANFRLRNSGSYTGDTATWTKDKDAVLWSPTTPGTAGTAQTQVVALNDLQDNASITGHFVRQYNVSVAVADVASGTPSSTAIYTAGQAGTATAAGSPATKATVDAGTYITAQFTKEVGETLQYWVFDSAKGELYSELKADGTVDTTKPIASNDAAGAAFDTVYFVPKAGDATTPTTLTAMVDKALYTVKITVNLDNAEETDTSNIKVEMKKDNAGTAIPLSYDGTDKWHAKVRPGNYTIYTNVANGKGANTTQVAGTISFDEDDGEKSINPAHTSGDAAKLTNTFDYYTINLATEVATPGVANAGNTVKFKTGITSATTAGVTAQKIVLATGTVGNVIASPATSNSHGGAHYRFVNWTASTGTVGTGAEATYTLPALAVLQAKTDGSYNIDAGHQITLTAHFVQQYRVEVRRNTPLSSSNGVAKVKKADDNTAWDNAAVTSVVLVDADSAAKVYATNTGLTVVALKDWTIQSGKGTFENAGHTVAAANSATDVGYLFDGATQYTSFTPTEDAILQVNGWTLPKLETGWIYDIGTGDGTSPKEPGDRKSTWTKNNATAVTGVHIVSKPEDTSPITAIDLDGHYTVTPNGTTQDHYTVGGTDPQTYFRSLVRAATNPLALKKNYSLQLTYTLGEDGHPNQKTGQTAIVTIQILSNPVKLRQVDIEVNTDNSTTILNENINTKDKAVYAAHWEKDKDSDNLVASNIPVGELQFEWYYGSSFPAASSKTQTYTDAQVTNALTSAGATKLTTAQAAALVESFAVGSETIQTGKLKVDATSLGTLGTLANTLKGKYIFAVVKVEAGSDNGEGTVITNALSVDYEGKITLKKDADEVGKTVANHYNNYKVYLVPSGVTPNWTADLAGQGICEATHHTDGRDADGVYSTEFGALDITKSYCVYVNDVEDDTTTNHNYVKVDNNTVSRSTQTKTVQYYSVNLTNVNKTTDRTDADGNGVGETFNDDHPYPSFTAAVTGTSRNVESGNGVLSGTEVTATSTTWDQDYTLTWQKSTGNDALKDTTSTQTSGTTAATYANGAVNAKTNIGGRLVQNWYTITGDIKGSGQIEDTAASGKRPTLTNNGHTFVGTVSNSGAPQSTDTVSFTVPRSNLGAGNGAITGDYVLAATAKSNPATTLEGYAVTAGGATTTTDSTATLNTVKAGDSGAALKGRFTIFIKATKAEITVHDDTDPVNTASASDKGSANTGNGDQWTEVFANYGTTAKLSYKVTIENKGNAPLNVALELIRIKGGTETTLYKKDVNQLTGTNKDTDDTNDVQFSGLVESFPLDEGANKDFTVIIPENLDNDDDVTYRFKFTTSDSRDGFTSTQCPTGQYDLKLTINPVKVHHVGTVQDANGTFTAQYTWIEQDSTDITDTANANGDSYKALKKPTTDDPTRAPAADDDLIYEWYVASWDANVSLNASGVPVGGDVAKGTGIISTNGLTYTPASGEHGKALYLVVRGRTGSNATGAAMTPDRTKGEEPVPVPYAGKVEIWHNDTKQPATGSDAPAGYAVYLWNTKDGTFDIDSDKVIATKWDGYNNYFTTEITDLWPGETYAVYTNVVRGQISKTSDFKALPSVSIDETHQAVVKAIYRQVNVANTTVSQNGYNDLGTVEKEKSKYFYQTADGTTVKAPQEKPDAAVAGFTGVNVAGEWVRNGTEVTFTYDEWSRDYDLNWTGGVSASGANADKPNNEDATHKVTYSSQIAEVKTELKLNLYEVKAEVTGSVGSVGFIEMTLSDKVGTDAGKTYTFITRTGKPGKIHGATADWTSAITIGSTVLFRLPKADGYKVSGDNDRDPAADFAGYTYGSNVYDYVAPDAGAGIEEQNKTFVFNTVGDAGLDKYEVRLKGEGLSMRVKGDVPNSMNKMNLVSPATTSVAGQATILPSGTDRTPTGTNATDTVYLNYNYGQELPVVVTISNESRQGANEDDCVLRKVTFVPDAYDANQFGVGTHAFNVPGKDLTRTGNADDGWTPESGTVSLTIKSGLPVGEHTFSGTFTFSNSDATPLSNTVKYTLKVIVQPLTFTGVEIDRKTGVTDGTLTITEYTVTRARIASDTDTTDRTVTTTPDVTAPTTPDSNTNLTQGGAKSDYGYQWIRTAPSVTSPNIASVSADGTLTASGTANYEVITGATNGTYTPKTDDEGQNLYLVIYGKDVTTDNTTRRNATGFYVSGHNPTPYSGIVYVNVDDHRQGKAANEPDPGYTVEFYKGETKYYTDGTWKAVETETNTNTYAYVSEKGLEPGEEYTVKVSRTTSDVEATATMELYGGELTGTKIGKTIAEPGNTESNNFTNVMQVDYYTVNAVKLSAKEFKKGTGEPFDYAAGTGGKDTEHTDIEPKFTIGTGANAAALGDGKSVLKGQKVVAKVTETEENSGIAWEQDYTLTWQDKTGDGSFDNVNKTNDTPTTSTAATAVSTGYTHTSVTAKTYIGGRLDQNTYTVVGTVKNPTGLTGGNTDPITLAFKAGTGDSRKFMFKTYYQNATPKDDETKKEYQTGKLTGSEGTGIYGAVGDTATFTVVKGEYTITAYEGDQTNIQYVKIGGYGDPKVTVEKDTEDGLNNTETLTPAVDGAGRIFSVYVAQQKLNLGLHGTMKASEDTITKVDASYVTIGNIGVATNTHAFYYNGTATSEDESELTLTNPEANGTGDLWVTAQVFKRSSVPATSDYADATKWDDPEVLTGTTYTDKVDGITDAVKITDLPIDPMFVPVGAGDVGGTAAKPGGNLSIKQEATTKTDAVYIIRYTSTRTDTNGTSQRGPIVYYVLDLTVKPLPIEVVADPVLSDAATGKLSVSGTAYNDVTVSYEDTAGASQTATADKRGLDGTDVIYVWAKAPKGVTVTKNSFVLADGADIAVSASAPTGVELVTAEGTSTLTYTPKDEEQGMNFYLLAVRSTADGANATDFAVSGAMYAQVTVALEARRTIGDEDTSGDLRTEVQITGVLGEGEDAETHWSNTDADAGNLGFNVTGADDTITFTADETDVTHKDTTNTPPKDDPANAKYYFVGWGVDPDDAATVPERSLTWAYPVVKKSTVIGYYDLLPSVTGSKGYNTDASSGYETDDEEQDARTITYTPHDGSGNTTIWLEWEEVIDEETEETEAKSQQLSVLNFAKYPETFGAGGEYILDQDTVKGWKSNISYKIVFYDMEKGKKNGGYEGYDKYIEYTITAGEKTVNAMVTDIRAEGAADAEYGGKVKITNGAPDPKPNATEFDQAVTLPTYNVAVTLHAQPENGYVFVEWTKEKDPETGKDKGKGKLTSATSATTEYTNVQNIEETVFATFKKAELSMDEVTAKIRYGDNSADDFEGGAPVMVASSSATGTPGNDTFTETFTYAFATDADLEAEGLTGAKGTHEWLKLNADGTVTVVKPVDTNVKSDDDDTYTEVEDEIVVYVKATANSTKETVFSKLIINVEPGDLNVIHTDGSTSVGRGDEYVAANLAGATTEDGVTTYPIPIGDDNKPLYDKTVLKKLFTYVEVQDQKGTKIDDVAHAGGEDGSDSGVHENGTWDVSPGKFSSSGEATKYNFTFKYKPNSDSEKWNYNAGKTDMTITVAKPPVRALFADIITNFDDISSVLKPGVWSEDEETSDYSVVENPEGYDATHTEVPVEMAYSINTFRKNETLTYLDTEPTYTVKVKSEDAPIYGVKFEKTKLDGFELDPTVEKNAYPDFTTTNDQFAKADGEKTFTLRLTTRNEDGLWKGTHTAIFTLTGYRNADEMEEDPNREAPTVRATYTLVVEMLARPITSLNIEIENPEDETPKKVEGTLKGSDTLTDLTKPDDEKHHVTPLKNIEIVPEIGPDNETVIKRTVEVEIDPNYIYVKDDDTTPDDNEDITENTKLNGKGKTDGNIDVERKPLPADPEKPDEPEDTDHIVFITQRIPALMFDDVKTDDGPTTPHDPAITGPSKNNKRGTFTITKGSSPTNQYEIHLGAYGSTIYGIDVEMTDNGLEGATLTPEHTDNHWNVGTLDDVKAEPAGDKYTWTLDLSGLKTEAPGTYNIKLHAKGYAYVSEEGVFSGASEADYTLTIVIPNPPAPGGFVETPCPCKVFYHIGIHGTTADPTVEDVAEKTRPTKVPAVTAVDGYTFRGWSLTNPATLKDGEKITLVDPKTVEPKGEAMTFYAVIQQRPYHTHYVIGYPSGNFGPADNITRASVATIIARAILPDFVEGANYGNPGGYSDVSGHWAESAIAYCSKYDVFNGMPDGTFQPDRPITRQEFALVMARLDGVMEAGEMDFTDIDDAGSWALDGIYTAYAKGWVNGYPDGTVKPLNNIRRDEAVKVFNAYLGRGVDADGLYGLTNYKTWADVPANHWAYYEIIEASNDHEYEAEMDGTYTVPETWNKSWTEERWGGKLSADAAMVSAGFQVWLH